MGCASSKNIVSEGANDGDNSTPRGGSIDPPFDSLVAKTHFREKEIESLQELYTKLSNELHYDGLMHKDELAWALFKCHKDNLFVDRVFELFDMKQNNVIDFEEFVLSLSVFHPNAPLEEKAKFAFRIYDINQSGAIEPPELKRFLVAIMADNPDIYLDDEALDQIVTSTFKQVDISGDGKINPEEWMTLVHRTPSIISFMTLPVLASISQKFPPSPATRLMA